jgi:hypothetical protein
MLKLKYMCNLVTSTNSKILTVNDVFFEYKIEMRDIISRILITNML